MTTLSSQIVSNLETMAEDLSRQMDSQQPNPPNPSVTFTQVANPSKKRKTYKKKRAEAVKTGQESGFNMADIQDKSAATLRCLAEKFATTGMSGSVLKSILEFHEEIDTMIAIKALELGVTVSAMEEVFGKFVGVRRRSAWNNFLRSDLARATFKAAGGIHSGQAMKVLGAAWKNMDQAEKETYKETDSANTYDHLQLLDEQLDEVEVGTHSRQAILQPRTKILLNARSLKKCKDNACQLLDETLAKCIPVAKTNNFELVIIAVSNHLSKHNFQITRNTVGADKAVEVLYKKDGTENFPCQLQAYLMGKSSAELFSLVSNSGRTFQSRVVHALSDYLHDRTKLKHWPWTKCDSTLFDAGFRFRLLPGARSVEKTFKEASSNLNQAKLVAMEADLKEGLIYLEPIDRSSATAPASPSAHTNTIDPTETDGNLLDPMLTQ